MVAVALEDLLLADLSSRNAGGDRASPALTELVEQFGTSSGRLSDQFELVHTIEQLREQGLVAVDGADGREESTVRLTGGGEEQARAVRERLTDTKIGVVDGSGRRELRLAEAADEFDQSLAGIAAQLGDDGVYYRDDSPERGLLDRTAEYDRCTAVIETVRRTGNGRAVFLPGAAGEGKTRLAEAVLDGVGAGAAIRSARCLGVGSEPFQPLRDVLADPASLATFDVTGSEIDDPDRFASRQTALFHDLTERLVSTSATLSVLFLDDLHLADSETMAYLSYLLDTIDQYPLVLLGTYRPAGLPEDAAFGGRFDPASGSDAAGDRSESGPVYVSLEPLDRETTRGIVEQTVDHRGAPPEFVDVVHERTGGNPLYIEETVRTLLETDQLDGRYRWYPTDIAEVELPDAVKQTIRQQIDSLGRPERELLRWAAVIGKLVPADLLDTVCDLPSTQFDLVVETLVGADIFTWVTDESLSFRSGVIRESLLETIDPDQRRRRHSVVAEAMAAAQETTGDGSPDDDRAAAIATQFEQAGEHVDAIEWYSGAGERAMDIYAHQAAVDHFDDALRLATTLDDTDRVLELSERQAEVLFLLGEYDDAERRVRFVRERTAGDDRRLRMALLASRIANARGDYGAAVEEASAGLDIAGEDSPRRGELLDQKALAERRRNDLKEATGTTKRLVTAAQHLEDVTLQARAHKHLGVIGWRQSDYDAARHHHRTALDLLDGVDDPHPVATIHNNLGVFSLYQSDYPDARTHLEDALTTYRELGDRHKVALACMNLAVVEGNLGNFRTAESYSEEARESYRAVGDRHGQCMARNGLGRIKRFQGEPGVAQEYIESALEGLTEVGDKRYIAVATVELGAVALETGDTQRARGRLQEALDRLEAVDDTHEQARARWLRGLVALEDGERSVARDYLEEARETFQSVGDDHGIARVELALGRVAARAGEDDRALERWREALDTVERIGAVVDQLSALERLASTAREREDWESHREYLDRAAELLDGVPDDTLEAHRDWVGRERTHLGE